MTDGVLDATAGELIARLVRLGPEVRSARRLMTAGHRSRA